MTAPVELALHLVGEATEWDVVAHVDERACVADLAAALEGIVGHRPQLFRFGEVLDDARALGAAGVRAGDTLGVDLPLGLDLRRFGPEVHVVSGQGAGQRSRVTNRALVVGRGEGCDFVLRDGRVSRSHVELLWTGDAFTVTDLGSRNGTIVDGALLKAGESRVCTPGDPVLIGDTVVTISSATPDVSATRPTGPFHLTLTSGTRAEPSEVDHPIAVPPLPTESRTRRSMILLAAPIAGAGAVAAAGAPLPSVLAFSAVPAVIAGAMFIERVRGRRIDSVDARRYARAEALVIGEIQRRRLLLERRERALWPDPAALSAAVARRSALVWSRLDAPLRVRVGVADRPGAVAIAGPAGVEHLARERTARLVPVIVDLHEGAFALIGPERDLDGVTAWLVVQAAALFPPDRVEIVVVTSEPARWAWLELLPHPGRILDVVAAAEAMAVQAQAATTATRLMIFDRLPVESSALIDLARPDDVIVWRCIDAAWLPPATATTLTAGAPGRILKRHAGGTTDVVPDAVDADVALQVARDLSGLRVPSSRRNHSLPGEVRLVDVMRGPTEVRSLVEDWRRDDGALEALIGVDARGPVSVRLEGLNSHALVAGSTGSGKTKLLETLVVSLATRHAPDRFSFFVVDFKGGNELARLAALPHCVGFVSDRDQVDVGRAVRALTSEIARRDEVLAAAGAADLADFERRTSTSMSRLLVVADEFGQFRRDDSNGSGVAALLRVAAQGRSKGVHLVLATQSPSTDVTSDIRQNVGVRICLRVAEAAESVAVIGVGDAARLPACPGRAVLLLDGEMRELQTALTRARSVARPMVAVRALGDAVLSEPATIDADDDLHRITALLRAAAQAIGVEVPPLLTPALSDRMERAGAPGASRPWTVGGLVLGVLDRPGVTDLAALTFDPVTHGTMVVIGGPRSGRTTALHVAAAAARAQADPEHGLVVYAVDWSSGGGLDGLRGSSGEAGIVTRGDFEHLRRLVAWLRSDGIRGVTRLVLIDRLDTLLHDCRELDGGGFPAELVGVLNDGPARGVHAIVTIDAPSSSAGPAARVGGLRLVLPLGDPAHASAAGLPRRDAAPPGRAVVLPGGLEAQIGLPEQSGRAELAEVQGRVDALPDEVPVFELPPTAPEHVLLGLGGTTILEPITVDLDAAGPAIVLIGRAGSGRTTAIETMRSSYSGRRRVVDLHAALTGSSWDALLDAAPALFLADDEPSLRAVAPMLAAADLPEQLAARGHVLIAAFDQGDLTSLGFGHWLMRRPRPGLLLSLDSSADRLLACERVAFAPAPELRAGPSGRGWWCQSGTGTPVQVAQT